MTGIEGRSGGSYDLDGNPLFYSGETNKDYVSIYKIDVILFQETFNVQNITKDNFNFLNLEEFLVSPKLAQLQTFLGLDLDPLNQIDKFIDNYNLCKYPVFQTGLIRVFSFVSNLFFHSFGVILSNAS